MAVYSAIKYNVDYGGFAGSLIPLATKSLEKISDNACTGAYGFNSIYELKKYTSYIARNYTEFYMSGVIKKMIKNNCIFKNKRISNSNFICLGTPMQLKFFYNNYPKISSINNEVVIKKKRICFDLDNTLVTYPIINGDYTTVKPIEKNIKLLKYLKCFGNTIIIYTARRMKTHNGNVGKINADVGKITFETLEKFDIPYDEIYFGKPYADFYIDDLAVNCFDDIERQIGFYDSKIKPRDLPDMRKACRLARPSSAGCGSSWSTRCRPRSRWSRSACTTAPSPPSCAFVPSAMATNASRRARESCEYDGVADGASAA